jgi:hypothetical protein
LAPAARGGVSQSSARGLFRVHKPPAPALELRVGPDQVMLTLLLLLLGLTAVWGKSVSQFQTVPASFEPAAPPTLRSSD